MLGLLILFGVAGALTTLWLGLAALYVSSSIGWANLLTLPPSDLALFGFGAVGPVVGMWLIVGLLFLAITGLRQEQVTHRLVRQATRSSEQSEAQVRSLIEMQMEGRRREVVAGIDLALRDLNAQSALIAERLGMVTAEEADALWARALSGDQWAFANAFLVRDSAYPDFADMLADRLIADDVAVAALQVFLRRYRGLSEALRDADVTGPAADMLHDGTLERLYSLFERAASIGINLRTAAQETESSGEGWSGEAFPVEPPADSFADLEPDSQVEPEPQPASDPPPRVDPAVRAEEDALERSVAHLHATFRGVQSAAVAGASAPTPEQVVEDYLTDFGAEEDGAFEPQPAAVAAAQFEPSPAAAAAPPEPPPAENPETSADAGAVADRTPEAAQPSQAAADTAAAAGQDDRDARQADADAADEKTEEQANQAPPQGDLLAGWTAEAGPSAQERRA